MDQQRTQGLQKNIGSKYETTIELQTKLVGPVDYETQYTKWYRSGLLDKSDTKCQFWESGRRWLL